MKTQTVPRHLYLGSKRIAETEDEQWEIIRDLASSLDDYVDRNKEHATNILRKNGIDPDSLFDIVKVELIDEIARPKFEWAFLKWAALQRDSLSTEQLQAIDVILQYEPLSPEAHQAIDVILQCQAVQRDLDSRESRDTLCNGIRLATAIEHLDTNIALWPTVEKKRQHSLKAKANNQKRRVETEKSAAEKWQPFCDKLAKKNPRLSWHAVSGRTAEKFGCSISKIKRYCEKAK